MENNKSSLYDVVVCYGVNVSYPFTNRINILELRNEEVNKEPLKTHGAKIFESDNNSIIVDILELDDVRIFNFIETMKGYELKSNVALLTNEEKESLLNFIETLDSGQ